jgi:hypothetical protein
VGFSPGGNALEQYQHRYTQSDCKWDRVGFSGEPARR